MNDVCTDAEMIRLIEGAQRWERAAVDRLYDLYADKVFRYLWYRVGDRETAEDLTADVFVRFLEHIGHFRLNHQRPVASFSAWLFRIAGNRLIDHYRHKQRRPETEMDEHTVREEGEVSPSEQALSAIAADEVASELQSALSELTETQQQVILYKFVEGMSNAEVGQMIGKTEGAVKSLQHRALSALQRALHLSDGRKA